jgi:hypothetical protein
MNSRLCAALLAYVGAQIGAAFAALVRSQRPAAASTALYRNQSIDSCSTIAAAAATAKDFAVRQHDVMFA